MNSIIRIILIPLLTQCIFAGNEVPPSLNKLCGEHAYKDMVGKLFEKYGAVSTMGPKIKIPWSEKLVPAGVLIEAAKLVEPVSAIERKDLAAGLASERPYWRIVSLGVVLGHAKSALPKAFSYNLITAVNRPATEAEMLRLINYLPDIINPRHQ